MLDLDIEGLRLIGSPVEKLINLLIRAFNVLVHSSLRTHNCRGYLGCNMGIVAVKQDKGLKRKVDCYGPSAGT